jgi:hypothetical protein
MRKLYHTKGEKSKRNTAGEVVPFFISNKVVVSFFVIEWLPNQIIVATQKGNHCPESNWKLVPDIIDKYKASSASEAVS